ncbi:MAG: hypothetical protein HYU66_12240 [Armatimonadetes bacterium]|nr:hypothetical protein [Armatimonadota bacterium]
MQPRLIQLRGSPFDMGRQYGAALRDEIHALAEERLRLSLLAAPGAGREQALALAARMLPLQEAWAPAVHAEFMGIAEGAGIAPELLLIGNGYTDFKDVLCTGAGTEECSSFWVRPDDGSVLCGQTWDMHATAEPFVLLVHRRPDDGPATLSFTTAGCLSLIGINSAGFAVGNTNLVPTDARLGVIYLAMIHRVLASATWDQAVQSVTAAPRSSGHHYYLADGAGHAAGIETTATRHAALGDDGGTYVHTNHYEAPELLPLAAPLDAGATTCGRAARLRELLDGAARPVTPPALATLLADHAGPTPICVHNAAPDGGKSCGLAILSPRTREMWVRVGNPCGGEPERVALDELD